MRNPVGAGGPRTAWPAHGSLTHEPVGDRFIGFPEEMVSRAGIEPATY